MSNQSLIGEDEEVKQSYEEFSIRDTYGRGTKRERETQRPLKTPAEPAPKNQSSFGSRVKEYLTTYPTNYELRIKNRNLGYLALALNIIIVGYFIIYVFLIQRLHIEKEKAIGSSFVWLHGKSHSGSDVDKTIWDLSEQLKSKAKPGIITLPTRVRITKNQKIGECPSPIVPCRNNSDCQVKNFPNINLKPTCSALSNGNKGCEAVQWCPAEDINNPNVTQVLDLLGVSSQEITVKSFVSFPSNTNEIEDLLTLAGTSYHKIQYVGCVIQLNAIWRCNLDSNECVTYYEVLKLDKDVGYAQKHVTLNKENGDIVRQEIHYSGIKLSVSVVGIGESFSLGNLVIYLFSTIVLLYGVRMIIDALLMSFAREKRHYSELKYEYVSSR